MHWEGRGVPQKEMMLGGGGRAFSIMNVVADCMEGDGGEEVKKIRKN